MAMTRRGFLARVAVAATAAAVPFSAATIGKPATIAPASSAQVISGPSRVAEAEPKQLSAQDIQDLVKSTLDDLMPMRFQQIADDLEYYEVFSKWFRKDKVDFDSGRVILKSNLELAS
jgi:hypothetical protein